MARHQYESRARALIAGSVVLALVSILLSQSRAPDSQIALARGGLGYRVGF